jgi:hypothetical protein
MLVFIDLLCFGGFIFSGGKRQTRGNSGEGGETDGALKKDAERTVRKEKDSLSCR